VGIYISINIRLFTHYHHTTAARDANLFEQFIQKTTSV
jgi:hypothetical protein